MKQHSVLLAVAATAIIAAPAGCSTHSPYYDKDGPPSVGAHIESSSATPKIEAFRQAANRPYTVLGTRYSPMTTDQPLRQRGTASWYGKQFHGNKTSIGEVYDMYQPLQPTRPCRCRPMHVSLISKTIGPLLCESTTAGPFCMVGLSTFLTRQLKRLATQMLVPHR